MWFSFFSSFIFFIQSPFYLGSSYDLSYFYVLALLFFYELKALVPHQFENAIDSA